MKYYLNRYIVIIFLLACYVLSYNSLLALRNKNSFTQADDTNWLINVSPNVLSFMAGEFKGLVASYLTLEIGARIGTQIIRTADGKHNTVQKDINWQTINKLFTLSQFLDPAFQQTYFLAQGNLPWDAKMVEETQSILQTAAVARPWDWQPIRFQAFNAYYFLNNFGDAGTLMLQAGRIKNAPSFLTILGARLAQQGNQTEAAVILMKAMLADKTQKDPGFADMKDRLHALEGVWVLENAVNSYQRTFLKLPENIEELVQVGLLQTLPNNPYNIAYCIDSVGKVHFDSPHCQEFN